MRDDIAFLHTAQVHVPTFERLVRAQAPALRVRHAVDEALLADARIVGTGDAALAARVHAAMREAASGGATVVACTCSTIGGIAAATPTDGRFAALRIDRAMADRAVRAGPRVLVAAALQSTLEPTLALVREAACDAGLAVAPQALLVDGAWVHFQRGENARYVAVLAEAIRAAPGPFDAIVLAQASMAPVEQALADLGIEVLSSPAPGVAHVLSVARSRCDLSIHKTTQIL